MLHVFFHIFIFSVENDLIMSLLEFSILLVNCRLHHGMVISWSLPLHLNSGKDKEISEPSGICNGCTSLQGDGTGKRYASIFPSP